MMALGTMRRGAVSPSTKSSDEKMKGINPGKMVLGTIARGAISPSTTPPPLTLFVGYL